MALSMRDFVSCVVVMAAVSSAQPARALDPRYPDWPCQQLKVPEISIASVWNGPSIESIDAIKPTDPKEIELVARLAARRTPMDDAKKLIADFVAGTKEQRQEKAKTLVNPTDIDYARLVEEQIHAAPSDWPWSHKRWKLRRSLYQSRAA